MIRDKGGHCRERHLGPEGPQRTRVFLFLRPESSANVNQLVQKNQALQDQNNKLCRELSESAGQTALMFEKIIMVRNALIIMHNPFIQL